MTDDVPQGIDTAEITAWLSARVDVAPPLRFERIAGGQSNLTYRVYDATGLRWVLRRPPLGQVLATAHDMGRESRIIEALAPTDVPVAPLVGASLDDSVNGAPFYVMEFVPGHVVRGEAEAAVLSPEARAHAGDEIVDVMARIHAVDVDAVGLGDLGRREAYIPRQLKRWYGQWEKSKSREIPNVDAVHDALLAAVPDQGPAAIVHGDYRLDNCLLTDAGDVAAVLDWEICTLGDPLADLGLLVVYWGEDDSGFTALPGGATQAEGFPPASALIARYAEVSGRDVSQVDYYIAFGYWKLACILEGVYSRYRGGAMGASNDGAWELFAKQVEMLADAAAATVARMADGAAEVAAAYEKRAHRPLQKPVLVVALEGWIDAGMAASGATSTLLAELDTETVASFDADELLDHRARRPVLHLVAGVSEGLSWPSIEMLAAQDLDGRDLLILAGPEPDHSWRAFGHAVVGLASELDVEIVVGLGAYPATVPHTRPIRLSITAGSEDLASRWPFLRGSLDVPAGTQAVVERFAADRGLDSLTLWAQIPHYASGGPYPAGSIALLENLELVAGLRLPRGVLVDEASDTGERLDSAIARNDEHTAMLRALEADADDAPSEGEIPSGDELAAELERFLRDQGGA